MPALDPATYGPYSAIHEAGDLVFTAGQTGVDVETMTAAEDIQGQTKQGLENLASVLKTMGLELNDCVKTTVFLTDMGDFKAMNEVYLQYFANPRPARSCVAVKELPRVAKNTSLKFEIEAVALKHTAKPTGETR